MSFHRLQKGKKKAFPPPLPTPAVLCHSSNYLLETTNNPTLSGGGHGLFGSLKLPLLSWTVSAILSPTVASL